jgi:hypothetical protein
MDVYWSEDMIEINHAYPESIHKRGDLCDTGTKTTHQLDQFAGDWP